MDGRGAGQRGCDRNAKRQTTIHLPGQLTTTPPTSLPFALRGMYRPALPHTTYLPLQSLA